MFRSFSVVFVLSIRLFFFVYLTYKIEKDIWQTNQLSIDFFLHSLQIFYELWDPEIIMEIWYDICPILTSLHWITLEISSWGFFWRLRITNIYGIYTCILRSFSWSSFFSEFSKLEKKNIISMTIIIIYI